MAGTRLGYKGATLFICGRERCFGTGVHQPRMLTFFFAC